MRKLVLSGILAVVLICSACGGQEPNAQQPEPQQQGITIIAEGGEQTAQIAGTQEQTVGVPAPDTQDAAAPVQTADAHFESDVAAAIPPLLEQLTADMTQTYDADGNEVYGDGTRTVTAYEWDIEGQRAHRMLMDTALYRYIAEYLPNGRLFRVTAVPLSSIDPNVCADAYTVYAERYCYGTAYYGYLYSVEQDGVIRQTSYGPDGAPLFTYSITVNVYGESVEDALYDASGTLVCRAIGAEDADGEDRAYEDGTGAAIAAERYEELTLAVCGDWLNDYYGSVYGA